MTPRRSVRFHWHASEATVFVISHRWIVSLLVRAGALGPLQAAVYVRRQAATFLLFLLFMVGAAGFRLPGIVLPACILGWSAFR